MLVVNSSIDGVVWKAVFIARKDCVMRAVVQQVSRAESGVNHQTVGKDREGVFWFFGIGQDDRDQDLQWLAR